MPSRTDTSSHVLSNVSERSTIDPAAKARGSKAKSEPKAKPKPAASGAEQPTAPKRYKNLLAPLYAPSPLDGEDDTEYDLVAGFEHIWLAYTKIQPPSDEWKPVKEEEMDHALQQLVLQ